jgi:GDPmannose 4,6-dehydratase
MSRTALIIGITGQDGALLAALLENKGYRIHGTSRDAQMSKSENLDAVGVRDAVTLHSVAMTDFRSVIQTLAKVRPDEIYLLAGQSSVGLSFEQPVETLESIALGALNLLEAVRVLALPARVYNAGSGDCFGEVATGATEQTAFRPRSPYAVAKCSAHWTVANYREAYGLFACSGILFNHESPLRPARFVTRKVVAAACRIAAGSAERLLLGNLDVERDWGWAPEYVRAMWMMLQQESPQDFVIATGKAHSLRKFVELAFAEVGLDWREHVDLDEGLRRPTDIAHCLGSAAKAEAVLGWRAEHGLGDVIRLMVAAEQGRPWPVL